MRREFELFDGILPLIQKDFCAPWSEKIYAVDASEWGLGCTVSSCEVGQVKELGGFCERWRFKDPVHARARDHILHDPESVHPIFEYEFEHAAEDLAVSHSNFEGVPFAVVDREWQITGRHRWRKTSSMPVNEARATLYAVQHILRSP